MPLLDVQNLTFSFPMQPPLFQEVSFAVEAGEAVLITGRSGSGKSTLCRAVAGLIPAVIPGTLSGEIWVDGVCLSGLRLPEIVQRVGLMFQSPDDQLVATTVEEEIAFALENLCVPPVAMRARVEELLAQFQLLAHRYQDPARLSGGEKKRLTLASVLAMGSRVLILDEPMAGLDTVGRALVQATFMELLAQGFALVSIEHDVTLGGYANRNLHLHDGVLSEVAR